MRPARTGGWDLDRLAALKRGCVWPDNRGTVEMPSPGHASRAPGGRPRVLCVDDEPLVLEGLRDVLSHSFDVQVAGGGPEALVQLERDRYGSAVVISDMRMPGMDGASFLSRARQVAPLTVRMLLTGHADAAAAARAVNDGQIFRFLAKPCDSDELKLACAAAAREHRQMLAERLLLERAVDGSLKALTEALAVTASARLAEPGRVEHAGHGELDETPANDLAGGRTLTLGEAAEALAVSTSTVRRWADAGRIRAIRTSGGHRRFSAREVQRVRAAEVAQRKPLVRSVQPPVEPLPVLGARLAAAAPELAVTCTDALYDAAHAGWFASPTGREHVQRWALSVAASARTGNYHGTTEATRKLMTLASHTGASLLERYSLLERLGTVVLRDLQERGTDRGELLGARRLFVHLRQVVLEAGDSRG